MDVTWGGAFLAGIISFISPCVLPLVPPYLAYMAGVSMDELIGSEDQKRAAGRVFWSAVAFVLGFSTVFVTLGAGASAIGQVVIGYSHILSYVAGVVIIIMGLHFLGVFRIGFLYREARVQVDKKPAGPIGAYVMGLAFAFGWTPCIGPVLAAILAVASTEDTVSQGAILLGVYSAGLGVPFLIAAAFAGPFMNFMTRFRRHMGKVEKGMGILLIITGVMFLTGQISALGFWLLEMFPQLGTVG